MTFQKLGLKDYLEIITNKFNTNKKIKIIAIQGPSTSGKTTISFALQILLKLANKSCYVLNLDDFYETNPQTGDFYDYENPAIIRWDKIINLLHSFDTGKDVLEICKFKFKDSFSSSPIFIDNPKPEYIIVEGLFSHYLFSDKFFCFDEIKSNKKIEQIDFKLAFIKNLTDFSNFAILKIALTTQKEQLIRIRSERDLKERKFDSEKVRKMLEHVWASTENWVYNYSLTKPDIIIENGSFNFESLNLLKKSFMRYLLMNEGLNLKNVKKSPFVFELSELMNDN